MSDEWEPKLSAAGELMKMQDEKLDAKDRRIAELERALQNTQQEAVARVIASLQPVNPLTNRIPGRYLRQVEGYLAERFAPTTEDVDAAFRVYAEWAEQRHQMQQRITELEAALADERAHADRLAEVIRYWIPEDYIQSHPDSRQALADYRTKRETKP